MDGRMCGLVDGQTHAKHDLAPKTIITSYGATPNQRGRSDDPSTTAAHGLTGNRRKFMIRHAFYQAPSYLLRCRSFGTGGLAADAPHVNASNAPSDFDPAFAVVYPEFCSEKDHDELVDALQARLKRRRYQKGHWDAVITDYKEVELIDEHFSEDQDSIIASMTKRARDHLQIHHFPDASTVTWLPCHAIDLKSDGKLQKHVDSVKFSGGIVAGLSLLSPSIMRLVPDESQLLTSESSAESAGYVDLYLPPRSLYALTDVARYRYTHELLPSGAKFGPVEVNRDRRMSVIFRDAKDDEGDQ